MHEWTLAVIIVDCKKCLKFVSRGFGGVGVAVGGLATHDGEFESLSSAK